MCQIFHIICHNTSIQKKTGCNIQTEWKALVYQDKHITISPEGGPGQLSRYSDTLRAGRSGDRIPVWANFSHPLADLPWGHLLYDGYRVFFPGIKRPGCGLKKPHQSTVEVKERIELYLYCPSELSWPVLGRTLPCNFYVSKGRRSRGKPLKKWLEVVRGYWTSCWEGG